MMACRQQNHVLFLVLGLAFALLVAEPTLVHAAETGGTGAAATGDLPWKAPLSKIADALTGPVAYWMSLLGIFVAGAVLVFGGEVNQFVRSLVMLILVAAVMMNAKAMMTAIFAKSAVLLP